MARQTRLPDLSGYATSGDITTAINNAVQSLPQYVGNGAWMTRAELKANYPAGATQLGKLARVTDMWTTVRTTLICEQDTSGSGAYYWRPQRTDYAVPMTQTSGTLQLTPLVTPPSLVFKSTLLGAMSLAPQATDDVWPGCFWDIQSPSSLGLFSFTITGLVGGLTSTLLGGSRKRVIYTSSGFEAS